MTDKLSPTAAALRAFAHGIAQLANELDQASRPSEVGDSQRLDRALEQNGPLLAELARHEYEARKNREKHIDPGLLGEPAWDILLDLYIHNAVGKRVSVTSACLASRVPTTTALRYVGVLEQFGMIRRQKSSVDARVFYVELTPEARRKIGLYLQVQAKSLADFGRSRAVSFAHVDHANHLIDSRSSTRRD